VPLYSFTCQECRRKEDAYRSIDERDNAPECHGPMRRVLTAPMAFVRQDVRYESPLDGRHITNYQQHLNELARGDCVQYEPGIKQDQDRKQRERDDALEKFVDQTVDREIALMPAAKREKLTAELQGGLTAEPTRVTPQQTSFKEVA
jgi:putative FmdB family regulatory protein